jgi:hypothetical protein
MPLSFINILLLIVSVYVIYNRSTIKQFGVSPLLVVVLLNLFVECVEFMLNLYPINNKGSIFVNNFSLPIEFISYGVLYKRLFTQKAFLYIINGSIVIFPLITIASFINNQTIYPFHNYVFTFGCLFILFITLSFFIKLIIADYFLVNPLTQFYFWLSVGLLFFYLGGFMYLSTLNYLFKKSSFIYYNLRNLNFILNCFYYICIIISVKCLKTFPNSQIQSF